MPFLKNFLVGFHFKSFPKGFVLNLTTYFEWRILNQESGPTWVSSFSWKINIKEKLANIHIKRELVLLLWRDYYDYISCVQTLVNK